MWSGIPYVCKAGVISSLHPSHWYTDDYGPGEEGGKGSGDHM